MLAPPTTRILPSGTELWVPVVGAMDLRQILIEVFRYRGHQRNLERPGCHDNLLRCKGLPIRLCQEVAVIKRQRRDARI